MEHVDVAGLTHTIDWLEDEVRQQKAAVTKVQGQHDQVLVYLKDYIDQLQALQDGLHLVRTQAAQLPQLASEIQRIHSILNTVRDSITDAAGIAERHNRSLQSEVERMRTVVSESWQRIETLRRDLDPLPSRIQMLSDSQKRVMDTTQELGSRIDSMRLEITSIAGRMDSFGERDKHIDERFGDIGKELDGIRKRDDSYFDKHRIVADRVSVLEAALTKLQAEEENRRKLEELVNVQRVGLSRIEKVGSDSKTAIEGQAEQIDELARRIKNVDDKRETLSQKVEEHGTALSGLRDEITEVLVDYESMEEQQRVRHVTELQQQIKEIKSRISKLRNR